MTSGDRATASLKTASKTVFAIALVAAHLGCGQASPPLVIVGVTPARAYTDRPLILRIDAGAVRPALQVDVARGTLVTDVASMKLSLLPESADGLQPIRLAIRLETVEWDGFDFSLWARTPPGLAAGRYTLELVDPNGRSNRFAGAFEGLGPDPSPPTIEIPFLVDRPYLRAGSKTDVEIVADDGLGFVASIHWMTSEGASGDCPPIKADQPPIDIHERPRSRLTCVATLDAQPLGEADPALVPFSLSVAAQDVAEQQSTLEVALIRAKPPTIVSFSDTVGSLGGYQPFVVRGQFFLPGSWALIGGVPIVAMSPGGDLQDDRSIVGWTPPRNRAGPVSVEVRSPAGSISSLAPFTYVAPPRVRDIQPPVGPARGGIRVTVRGNDLRTGVVVYVGARRDDRQPLYNVTYDAQNKVVGCLPPGTGTASVWAYDPVTGDGELPLAFTYQDGGDAPSTDPTCQVPVK